MSQPPPPVDIKLHLHDGRVIPADSVYVGEDEQGFALWVVQTSFAHAEVKQMTMRELPPRTSVQIEFAK